jgi:hypothetical protein
MLRSTVRAPFRIHPSFGSDPEHLAKTAGISLRRSSATGKVLTDVFERLTKNRGNFIKMLTKSKMLTQISLRRPASSSIPHSDVEPKAPRHPQSQ